MMKMIIVACLTYRIWCLKLFRFTGRGLRHKNLAIEPFNGEWPYSSSVYPQTGRDPFPHPVTSSCGFISVASISPVAVNQPITAVQNCFQLPSAFQKDLI